MYGKYIKICFWDINLYVNKFVSNFKFDLIRILLISINNFGFYIIHYSIFAMKYWNCTRTQGILLGIENDKNIKVSVNIIILIIILTIVLMNYMITHNI